MPLFVYVEASYRSHPICAMAITFHHLLEDYPHTPLYAPFPSEHICTENLTPFLKLLPCKGKAGIAELLSPYRVFDADWHGMSVSVRKVEEGVELKMGVSAVLDPVRSSEPGHMKGTRS